MEGEADIQWYRREHSYRDYHNRQWPAKETSLVGWASTQNRNSQTPADSLNLEALFQGSITHIIKITSVCPKRVLDISKLFHFLAIESGGTRSLSSACGLLEAFTRKPNELSNICKKKIEMSIRGVIVTTMVIQGVPSPFRIMRCTIRLKFYHCFIH